MAATERTHYQALKRLTVLNRYYKVPFLNLSYIYLDNVPAWDDVQAQKTVLALDDDLAKHNVNIRFVLFHNIVQQLQELATN